MVGGHTDLPVDSIDRSDWALRDDDVREYLRDATGRVGSLVRTTLGPYGLEKLVETHDRQGEPETVLTGDTEQLFAAIQRGEGFTDPVAAMFVDSVDTVHRAVGDATGTTVLLGVGLIHRGLDLIGDGLHPSSVIIGYSMAAQRAGAVLDELATTIEPTDRDALASVASTTMTADIDATVRDRYADAVADVIAEVAAERDDGWIDTDDVAVLANTSASDGLHRGVVLRRKPGPAREAEDTTLEFDWTPSIDGVRHNAAVAIMDMTPAFGDAATAFDQTTVTADQYARDRTVRDERCDAFVDRLIELGVDIFVCRDDVEDDLVNALESVGIDVVDRVQYPKTDVYRLARATGADVVSHPSDIAADALGVAGRAVEHVYEDEKWTVFDDCTGPAFTLIVGADTDSGAVKRERVVEDALEVTSVAAIDAQLLPGAGAAAEAVAADLRRYAPSVEGREQLAVEAFADVLEDVPRTLARNAGWDPVDTQTALRSAHHADDPVAIGLDLESGELCDAYEADVVEPRRVFSQAIETARSSTEQLLSVDAVLFPDVDLDTLTPRTEHE